MTLPTTTGSSEYEPAEPITQRVPPTDRQMTRDKALRRFNWLYIYTPIIVVSLVSFGILLLLTWQSLLPNSAEKQLFLSGLADLILIYWMCPMVLLLSLGPLSGMYFLYKRREHGSYVRKPIQRLAWRTDNMIDKSHAKIRETQPKIAKPFVEAQGWIAFLQNLIRGAKNDIKRLFHT